MLRQGRMALVAAAIVVAVVAYPAAAQDAPVVLMALPDAGQQRDFGVWLQDALGDEPLQVEWPQLSGRDASEQAPACVVTWSQLERPAGETKQLRAHIRSGGGMVYVVGEDREHRQRARAFWGPLDVNIEDAGGPTSAAEWVPHPLTHGREPIGAVNSGCYVDGEGVSPLIRAGNGHIAAAFDWGPLGRAVIVDAAALFGQLDQASPRPAMRDFIVRSVLWAADAGDAAGGPEIGHPAPPTSGGAIGAGPVDAPQYTRAVVELPTDRERWPQVREVVLAELQRAGLEISEPRVGEGEALITTDRLERAGLLVLGSSREEVQWNEPLAVGWFFSRGGRILAIPHAGEGTMTRMIGFNQLLTQLRIAASLARPGGDVGLVPHPITSGMMLEEQPRVRGGAQVWAPLTDPLVTVRRRPAAAAWQLGEGRIVVIDGELLAPQGDDKRTLDSMRTLLRRSLDWLMGSR
ncbi:MAG: hypothetical protein GX131_19370 [candidate division WS1 bacterium]|nr:hypothetical protein [candidate division WS1 bacterium]